MASTIASRKSKGRRLQQYVRDTFRQIFKEQLEPEDIESRPMGNSGTDIILTPAARKLIPFDIEGKNSEKINIWAAIRQAESNQAKPERIPAVIFSRNHSKTYIVMEFERFLDLMYPGRSRTIPNEEPEVSVPPIVENTTEV